LLIFGMDPSARCRATEQGDEIPSSQCRLRDWVTISLLKLAHRAVTC
jgi:hypothetical protein